MRQDLYEDLYIQEENHWWHVSKRNIVKQMLGIFLPNKKLQLLDIGCGTGKVMDTLSAFGIAWGIDKSKTAIDFCKKRNLQHVMQGDASDTGFSEEFFDVVTMLDVLEHTEESNTLPEAKRILKKGGIMVVTVPAYQWLWSRWDEILHHKKRYGKNELERIVKQYGFTTLTSSYMYSFLLIPVYIFRKFKSHKRSYESDFLNNSSFTNFILTIFSRIERFLVVRGSVPFGTSLILICKK